MTTQEFYRTVREMREAQKRYFNEMREAQRYFDTRTLCALINAKLLEALVDGELAKEEEGK